MKQPRKLITEEIRRSIAPLQSTDAASGSAIAVAKYVKPDGSAAFYATEFDGEGLFFGLIDRGAELGAELGHWSVEFMREFRDSVDQPIVRDVHFQPKKLREICPDLFPPAPGPAAGLFDELPNGAPSTPVDVRRTHYRNGDPITLQLDGCDNCRPTIVGDDEFVHAEDCPSAWKDLAIECAKCGDLFWRANAAAVTCYPCEMGGEQISGAGASLFFSSRRSRIGALVGAALSAEGSL